MMIYLYCYNQIMKQDFDFFLNKSYDDDVSNDNTSGESPTLMLKYICEFKNTFPNLHIDVKNEFIYYMMNLTQLSFLYFKE